MNTTPTEAVASNAELSLLLEGCTVLSFAAGQVDRIDAVSQIDGSKKWAVRRNGNCLGKGGEWEYEPMPSSRDDEFLERCRFSTPMEAFQCLQASRLKA